ncbi:hypothetical protein M5K25_005217 [Dendrobium thyrsiflorum]|uniref:Uncharacterized protein n=1 Tax=Dendrobium thyrsiflorum TaxID=117978 RepID=A0ABD0VGW5_DENTH
MPIFTTSQLFHGSLMVCSSSSFLITNDILTLSTDITSRWVLLEDFNCYRYSNEKSGWNLMSDSKLWDFNNLIFNIRVQDLFYVGVFVNSAWLDAFLASFYFMEMPRCLDHSPLLLCNNWMPSLRHRFLFKIFGFWDLLIDVFVVDPVGRLINDLYSRLHMLKCKIKAQPWIAFASIDSLNKKQNLLLQKIQFNLLNSQLNKYLKEVNSLLSHNMPLWVSWIIQRIRSRHNMSSINIISTSEGLVSNPKEISDAYIQHFKKLFNPSKPLLASSHSIPLGLSISILHFGNLHLKMLPLFGNFLCSIVRNIKNNVSFIINMSSTLFLYWDPWCGAEALLKMLDSSSSSTLHKDSMGDLIHSSERKNNKKFAANINNYEMAGRLIKNAILAKIVSWKSFHD